MTYSDPPLGAASRLAPTKAARPLLQLVVVLSLLIVSPLAFAQEGDQDGDQPAEEQPVAAPAPRGPTPKIFVLPTESLRGELTPIVPERIGEMLRERVRSDSRVELLSTYSEMQRKSGGQHASAAVAEAERLYTSGIGLLTAGENQRAAETFQRAVDAMEQNVADILNFEILADAFANLSLAYFNAGFDLDARQNIQKFAHLRPTAKLDPERFPKALLDLLKDEQGKVKTAGSGKLVIDSNVHGAQVYIDGQLKGETPVTVEDVGFGYHYLVVRDARGGSWSEQIRVRGRGRAQDFTATLGEAQAEAAAGDDGDELPAFYTDLRRTIRTGKFGTDLQPYLRELATRTGASFIGWVVIFRDGSRYVAVPFVYRTKDGLLVQAAAVNFNVDLSNLRIGVNHLGRYIVDAVIDLPEDLAVTMVELGPKAVEEKPVAVVEKTEQPKLPVPGTEVKPRKDDEVIAPPKIMPSEGRSQTWKYVGWGGAAILVGGAIAGGVYYLSQSDGPVRPTGFDSGVTW